MNYIGSKHSLMDFLTETIVTVAGTDSNKIFADLFAGTGVVGKTFKQNGYRVIANDKRDNSGVHNASYHGNFVPQIPNQLFRRYTKKVIGYLILSPVAERR